MRRVHTDETPSFVTKDGSQIRELMHPNHHGSTNQSLAEATVASGATTLLHRHHHSEEIYYFLTGEAIMVRGDESFPVRPGDVVCIAPGTRHQLRNIGIEPLRLLCMCSPPYRHDDTEVLDENS